MPGVEPVAAALRVEVEELARRWAALPEAAMRIAALAEHLSGIGDARGVWVLEWLIRGARRGHVGCAKVYAASVMPHGLAAALGTDRLQALGLAAQAPEASACMVRHWLVPQEAEVAADDPRTLALVHRDLRKLTLGERRALGRRAHGDGLKRLVSDPDPGVITNLLNNPRITEETVLAICSRRPTVAAPLRCVLAHPRWNSRYLIRSALARNPATPVGMAVSLLVFLRTPDLRQIAQQSAASSGLKLAAERLIAIGREGDAVGDGQAAGPPGSLEDL